MIRPNNNISYSDISYSDSLDDSNLTNKITNINTNLDDNKKNTNLNNNVNDKTKIICFVSGYGSNLQCLINNSNKYNYEIACVISNKSNTFSEKRCLNNNIKFNTILFNKPKSYKEFSKESKQKYRDKYECIISEYVKNIEHSYIICLGWMHILGESFINNNKPIYNLHPSLPFDNKLVGINSIDRAWTQSLSGSRLFTGAMIHRVTTILDEGEIIFYKAIKIEISKGHLYYKNIFSILEKYVLLRGIQIITTN